MVWSISLSLVPSSNINMTRTRQSQNLCKRKEAHAHGAAYAVANLGNTLNLLDSAFWNAPHTSLAALGYPWITSHRAWHQRDVDQSCQSFTVQLSSKVLKLLESQGKGVDGGGRCAHRLWAQDARGETGRSFPDVSSMCLPHLGMPNFMF